MPVWKINFENDYVIVGEKTKDFKPRSWETIETFKDLFEHYQLVIAHKDEHGNIKEFVGDYPEGYSVHFLVSAEEKVPEALKRLFMAIEDVYMQRNRDLFSKLKITISDGRKYWTVIVSNSALDMVDDLVRTYTKDSWDINPNILLNEFSGYFELLECLYRLRGKIKILEVKVK